VPIAASVYRFAIAARLRYKAVDELGSDLEIGWRRPFLYLHIYHIPIDLEGRLYRQWQRTTNTRPFPKSIMLFTTGYLAKTRESLPSGEAHLCTS
jgi:hypothetical protein